MSDAENAAEAVNPANPETKDATAPGPEPDEIKHQEEEEEPEDSAKPIVGLRNGSEAIPVPGESGLKRLGEVRDGLLVAASLLYTLGYLVRSFNAWQYKLGLLPAVQSQYFVAGLVPALITGFVYLSIRALRSTVVEFEMLFKPFVLLANAKANSFHEENLIKLVRLVSADLDIRAMFRKLLSTLIASVILAAVMVFVPLKLIIQNPHSSAFVVLACSLSIIIGYLLLETVFITLPLKPLIDILVRPLFVISPGKASRYKTLHRLLESLYQSITETRKAQLFLTPIIFGILGVYLYVVTVYPRIPQEFGGAEIRQGYIDLAKEEVSAETLSALEPTIPANIHADMVTPKKLPGADKDPKVVRSDLVNVFFSGDEYMLVRPSKAQIGSQVYEIRKGAIKNVIWGSAQSKP